MPSYGYDRLSAQDNSFLLWETPYVHMHVASTLVFESGPFRTADGGVDINRLTTTRTTSQRSTPRGLSRR